MNETVLPPAEVSGSLSRSLAPRHLTMISIGGMIGAGLFVASSAAIVAAGPAIVLSYLIAGAVVLLIMRMLGEMAVAMPRIQSFADFARAGLGHWAGFTVGWLYWFFWIVVVPVEAIAGAKLLQLWLPLPMWELGLVLVAIMTIVNLMSARSFGEFEFWFASIKVAAIIVFIVLAASAVFGLNGHSALGFGNLTSHAGFMPFGPIAVLAGVTTVFFSLAGAEIVTIAAAESSEPAQAVARLTSSVVWRILIFYVGSILLIVTVIPWNSIIPGHSPFTSALQAMHVPYTSTIMSLIILTAVLSCLNSCFYVTSRVLFALAKQGDAPGWLVKTSANHVPRRSVMLGSIAGVAGVLADLFSPNGVFAFLINASGALFLFIYIAIAAAQIRLRYARQAQDKPEPPLRMWLFPWTSYLAIAAMIGVLIAMAITPELAQELWVSLLTVAITLIAFATLRARRALAQSH
jgi:GABA permease